MDVINGLRIYDEQGLKDSQEIGLAVKDVLEAINERTGDCGEAESHIFDKVLDLTHCEKKQAFERGFRLAFRIIKAVS